MVATRSKTKSASMIGVMPGTLYVKIWAFMMVGYAAQMLLIPANMVTDHWDIPSTPGMEFWIRGASIGFGCTAYLLTKVDTETVRRRRPRASPEPAPAILLVLTACSQTRAGRQGRHVRVDRHRRALPVERQVRPHHQGHAAQVPVALRARGDYGHALAARRPRALSLMVEPAAFSMRHVCPSDGFSGRARFTYLIN